MHIGGFCGVRRIRWFLSWCTIANDFEHVSHCSLSLLVRADAFRIYQQRLSSLSLHCRAAATHQLRQRAAVAEEHAFVSVAGTVQGTVQNISQSPSEIAKWRAVISFWPSLLWRCNQVMGQWVSNLGQVGLRGQRPWGQKPVGSLVQTNSGLYLLWKLTLAFLTFCGWPVIKCDFFFWQFQSGPPFLYKIPHYPFHSPGPSLTTLVGGLV